jgi:hypothetical protein
VAPKKVLLPRLARDQRVDYCQLGKFQVRVYKIWALRAQTVLLDLDEKIA